jgi:hypothetical protein
MSRSLLTQGSRHLPPWLIFDVRQKKTMSFIITHRYGAQERATSVEVLPALLRELEDRPEDTEHGSVSVAHESEWSISVYRGGYLTFENLEDGGESHMRGVKESEILRLLAFLAAGDIDSVRKAPWKPGYQ